MARSRHFLQLCAGLALRVGRLTTTAGGRHDVEEEVERCGWFGFLGGFEKGGFGLGLEGVSFGDEMRVEDGCDVDR